MCAADLRKFLKEEYGIQNDEDFEMAVNASTGIDLGMFTVPFRGGERDDRKAENVTAA